MRVRTPFVFIAILLAMATAMSISLPLTSSAMPVDPPAPAPMPGTVTLSLAEYNRLLDRSAAAAKHGEEPPIPSVVSRAELTLRAAGDVVRGTITLQGEVFRSATTSVPLLSGGTLLEAQLAVGAREIAVPLVFEGGMYRAILPGGKPFQLTLTWATTIASEPGRAVVVLPTIAASSVRGSIDAPGDHADIRVQPGVVTRRTTNEGRTQVEMTLEAGAATRVTWSSRDTNSTAATPPRELRLLSDVKTLATIGEADVKLAALFDITVLSGEPTQFAIHLPAGFEVASASGASVEATTDRTSAGILTLNVREPSRRRHQFLVTLERAAPSAAPNTASAAASSGNASNSGSAGNSSDMGSIRQELLLPWLEGAQRETGEAVIEGVGTLDLNAEERAPLHRIDATEVSAPLQALAREALLAAFRYQRRGAEPVALPLQVQRFPEAPVLAAIAERAVVTTLVTTQGRALTEVALTMRNQGQPFLKVGLPAGATLLSAEIEGVGVKLVEGTDGVRVPLLRAGFRPSGAYTVSFVYIQSGAAFEKKGDAAMTLARLDLPVSVLEWELYLPDRYEVKKFDGDVIASDRLPYLLASAEQYGGPVDIDATTTAAIGYAMADQAGNAKPTVSAPVPPPAPPASVAAEAVQQNGNERQKSSVQKSADAKKQQFDEPSVNVQNLQRRVAGVLPVRVDVPHAGHSYHFVRPLVVDEDTSVRFRYRSR